MWFCFGGTSFPNQYFYFSFAQTTFQLRMQILFRTIKFLAENAILIHLAKIQGKR